MLPSATGVLLGADGGQCIPADELAALLPDGTNGGVTADHHFRVRRVYRYDNATVAVSDVRYEFSQKEQTGVSCRSFFLSKKDLFQQLKSPVRRSAGRGL